MRVGLLHNPRARRARRDPRFVDQLRACLGPDDALVTPSSRGAMAEAVGALQTHQPEVLAITGGDGSLHSAITALLGGWRGDLPPIALLPSGTMNTTARGLGVSAQPLTLLQDLSHGQRLTTRHQRVLRVDAPPEPPQFGFLWGVGIWARFIELYDTGWPEPGPLKAAWVLGKGIASTPVGGATIRQLTRRVAATVQLDDTNLAPHDFAVIAAGTVPQVGLGFEPFPGITEHSDQIGVVAMASGVMEIARELWPVWRGADLRHPSNHSGLAQVLRVDSEAPLVYSLDGDLHRVGPSATVSAGPQLKIVTGVE